MKDIIRTLKEHGENCPNQVAVKHNEEILTYEALNRFANQLAILLKNAKTPLILYGHMSPFMIVGMIGSMKAGCGYVPLDTSIPQDRILSIIKKIEPQFIFNTTDEQLEIEDISFISKDLLTGVKQNEDTISKIKDSDIAYTIFTSGDRKSTRLNSSHVSISY